MQKKKVLFVLIILSILGISTNVYAFDLLINIDSKNLYENTFNTTLQVSDLEKNSEGINAISGKIIYDENVFENISLSGINNWSVIYNDEEGNKNRGKFVLITTSGNITETTDVAKILFKLKPNIKNVKTQIKIEQIESSYQSKKIQTSDKDINIEINNNNVEIVKNNSNDNIKKETKNYYIFVLIVAVIIITLLVIVKIKKERKTNEK